MQYWTGMSKPAVNKLLKGCEHYTRISRAHSRAAGSPHVTQYPQSIKRQQNFWKFAPWSQVPFPCSQLQPWLSTVFLCLCTAVSKVPYIFKFQFIFFNSVNYRRKIMASWTSTKSQKQRLKTNTLPNSSLSPWCNNIEQTIKTCPPGKAVAL